MSLTAVLRLWKINRYKMPVVRKKIQFQDESHLLLYITVNDLSSTLDHGKKMSFILYLFFKGNVHSCVFKLKM